MIFESSPIFLEIFNSMDIYTIIILRLVGFFAHMPVLSGRSVPVQTRMALIIIMSMVIFTSGVEVEVDSINNLTQFTVLLFKEFTVGYLLGFSIFFMFSIFYFAGQLMDYQMGFSMLSVFDPTSQTQVPITGNILFMAASTLFVITGGFHVVLDAFMQSYALLPIGAADILNSGNIVRGLLELVTFYFQYGMVVASPIVGSIIIIDISLGLLVKAVPQMNVFVVGAPIKLIAGLMLFKFTFPALNQVFDTIFVKSLDVMFYLIEGLAR